jgi:hypothetical protein
MAGNTSRIDTATLRVQWDSYVPMAAICQHWTITVHQLVRLRVAWNLEPRNDRKRRYKPTRSERLLEIDAAELDASESSLDLAPRVAERVTVVQSWWTPQEWADRAAFKPEAVRLTRLETPAEARDWIDCFNREIEP